MIRFTDDTMYLGHGRGRCKPGDRDFRHYREHPVAGDIEFLEQFRVGPEYFARPAGQEPARNGAAMTDVPDRKSLTTTGGPGRAPNRAMLRAVGFHDDDFSRPMVGVASLFSEITPCNAHLDRLARKGVEGVRAAGGVPQIFGAPTVSDGISMGHKGMRYSLVSREVIADSLE